MDMRMKSSVFLKKEDKRAFDEILETTAPSSRSMPQAKSISSAILK
jgi:hypothetical protein